MYKHGRGIKLGVAEKQIQLLLGGGLFPSSENLPTVVHATSLDTKSSIPQSLSQLYFRP